MEVLSVYLGQVFPGQWYAPEPLRMMPIFLMLSVALPVNWIRLFTEVGQHVQMPQGIFVLQENKETHMSSPASAFKHKASYLNQGF